MEEGEEKRNTPLKAIRLKCLDCMGGDYAEVKRCDLTGCSLHPFRLGKNPNRAGIGNSTPSAHFERKLRNST